MYTVPYRGYDRMRMTCLAAVLLASCGLDFSSSPVTPADGTDEELDGAGDPDDGDTAEDPGLDPVEELESADPDAEADPDMEPEPSNLPPVVSITSPSTGTMVQAGDSVDISVEARDDDGSVESIDLYRDGDWVAGSSDDSLLWTWTLCDAGHHSFHAVAMDDESATAESDHVEILVFETISFQDDVSPDDSYEGTADTNIKSLSPTTTYGLAVDLEADGVDPETPSDGPAGLLLRWDVSAVPSDSEVVDARLVIFPRSSTTASDTFQVYAVLRAWDEMEATWLEAETGAPWQTEGCLGSLDRDDAVLGTVAEGAAPSIVMDATPDFVDLVGQWVASPAQNFGIVVQDYTQDDGMHIFSREVWGPAQHPLLEISYVP
jgi:hypothetical protein